MYIKEQYCLVWDYWIKLQIHRHLNYIVFFLKNGQFSISLVHQIQSWWNERRNFHLHFVNRKRNRMDRRISSNSIQARWSLEHGYLFPPLFGATTVKSGHPTSICKSLYPFFFHVIPLSKGMSLLGKKSGTKGKSVYLPKEKEVLQKQMSTHKHKHTNSSSLRSSLFLSYFFYF